MIMIVFGFVVVAVVAVVVVGGGGCGVRIVVGGVTSYPFLRACHIYNCGFCM